jgi:hypothetical protein
LGSPRAGRWSLARGASRPWFRDASGRTDADQGSRPGRGEGASPLMRHRALRPDALPAALTYLLCRRELRPCGILIHEVQLARGPVMATAQTPATLDDLARVSDKAESIDGRTVVLGIFA